VTGLAFRPFARQAAHPASGCTEIYVVRAHPAITSYLASLCVQSVRLPWYTMKTSSDRLIIWDMGLISRPMARRGASRVRLSLSLSHTHTRRERETCTLHEARAVLDATQRPKTAFERRGLSTSWKEGGVVLLDDEMPSTKRSRALATVTSAAHRLQHAWFRAVKTGGASVT
jgi:hypothetical protein